MLDPGLDFAKTPAESVQVLRRLDELRELGRPILLAASRARTSSGALTGRAPARAAGRHAGRRRGAGSTAAAAILRVHDVAEVRDFLTVRAALRGEARCPGGAAPRRGAR